MSKRNSLLAAQRYVREYEVSVEASTGATHPYADPTYWAAFVLLDAVE